MSHAGRRPASLITWEPAQAPIYSRVCSSAPTQSIPDHDEDWGRKLLQRTSADIESLRTCASDDTRTGYLTESKHETRNGGSKPETGLEAVNAASQIGNAGDFTDFLDPSSPKSGIKGLGDSDGNEPYEYWEKAWSYSRSPFSNCSSLSFEDSDTEENAATDMCISPSSEIDRSTREGFSSTVQDQVYAPKLSRFSDLSPNVMYGWTALVPATESFKGSTSI